MPSDTPFLDQVCTVKNKISVYMYTAGTLVPRGVFTGNTNTSSYYIKAKLSPDGSLLASGSPGDAVCLWEVDSPGAPIARLEVSFRSLVAYFDACSPSHVHAFAAFSVHGLRPPRLFS